MFIDEADDALQDRRSSLNGHITANVSIEWLADMLEGLSIANLKEVLQQAVNQVIGEAKSGQAPVVERVHVIEARHMIETEARA